MDKIDDLHLGDIVTEAREDELERKAQAIKRYVKSLLTGAEDFERSIKSMQKNMDFANATVAKIEEGDWSEVPEWVLATINDQQTQCNSGLFTSVGVSGPSGHTHR